MMSMPDLVAPTALVRVSFLAAMAEFQAEERGASIDQSMVGDGRGGDWSTPAGFDRYVRWLRDQASEHVPRPPGYVPATTLWWVAGWEYLGRLAIRHRLTARLHEMGGHIGYDVRPTARRRGHATAMLAA